MQNPQTFVVRGGVDQLTSTLTINPGALRAAMNYEPITEGYASVDGYERFDGQSAPSDAGYWSLPYHLGSLEVTTGQIVIGSTSGARGRALLPSQIDSGTFAASTSAGRLILTTVTGTFVAGEILAVNGTFRARAIAAAVQSSARSIDEDEQFLSLAQEAQRQLIAKPPGDGPVRGVCELDGDVFAFRDNIGNTQSTIWRASSTGWEPVGFNSYRLNFSAGLVEIEEGSVIVGATSGAGATVERVVRRSGDWGTSAAGYLIVSGQSGAFVAETIKVGAVNMASIGGNSTQVRLPAGGNYRFMRHNFFGGTATRRVYGVNGVGNAFEFDGAVLCPIETGTPVDTPHRVSEHRNHLALGFKQGSLQLSSDGKPLIYDAVEGAAEIAVGAEITDLLKIGTALGVFCSDRLGVLSGTDKDSYVYEPVGGEDDIGADAYSVQKMGDGMYLDNRGVRFLRSAQGSGNFRYGSLTTAIEKLIKSKRKRGIGVALSFVSRSKGHYRLVWTDGTGFTLFQRGRDAYEIIPFEYGDMRPVSVVVSEDSENLEAIYIGASDGYVYRMDKGTSFDGEPINGFLMFPFIHLGSYTLNKRFHGVLIEIDSSVRTKLGLLCQFDLADGDMPSDGQVSFLTEGAANNDFVVSGGGGLWGVSDWNQFFWSTPFEGEAHMPVDGLGRNISLLISSRRAVTERAHVIKSYTVYSTPRSLQRAKKK